MSWASCSARAVRRSRGFGSGADIGIGQVAALIGGFGLVLDLVHQLRGEGDQLAATLLLQADGEQGTQVVAAIAVLQQAQGFAHDFAGVVVAPGSDTLPDHGFELGGERYVHWVSSSPTNITKFAIEGSRMCDGWVGTIHRARSNWATRAAADRSDGPLLPPGRDQLALEERRRRRDRSRRRLVRITGLRSGLAGPC